MTFLIFIVGLFLGTAYGHFSRSHNRKTDQSSIIRLWQMIEELQADNRALTESLCRAQGKPFIVPRGTEPLKPSDGWYDAKPTIEVKGA